jgi:hypothetical protein
MDLLRIALSRVRSERKWGMVRVGEITARELGMAVGIGGERVRRIVVGYVGSCSPFDMVRGLYEEEKMRGGLGNFGCNQ